MFFRTKTRGFRRWYRLPLTLMISNIGVGVYGPHLPSLGLKNGIFISHYLHEFSWDDILVWDSRKISPTMPGKSGLKRLCTRNMIQ